MKEVSRAVAHALLLPKLMEAGREVGYAIAVHGSLARDLDVIAVPWTDEAVSAERLILHLVAAVGGALRNGHHKKPVEGKPDDHEWVPAPASVPSMKPHGRLAWVIYLGSDGMYLDVSVMPRRAEAA